MHNAEITLKSWVVEKNYKLAVLTAGNFSQLNWIIDTGFLMKVADQ